MYIIYTCIYKHKYIYTYICLHLYVGTPYPTMADICIVPQVNYISRYFFSFVIPFLLSLYIKLGYVWSRFCNLLSRCKFTHLYIITSSSQVYSARRLGIVVDITTYPSITGIKSVTYIATVIHVYNVGIEQ
jgi:cytochrome c biogenesis factor